MRTMLAVSSVLCIALLAGCGSATRPHASCCYDGKTTVARLGDVPVTLRDGRQISFEEAFPGFAPHDGAFNRSLPFEEALGHDIIYQSLVPLVPLYDANGDGRLEEPEVVVMYAREAALGSGIEVAHLGAPPGIWALDTANADVGALVRWVEARRGSMSPQAQQIFTDLERLGLDIRTRGSDAGPTDDEGLFID